MLAFLLACADEPGTNTPPTVIATGFEPGGSVSIGPEGQSVYVLADDGDGDPLTFSWLLSRDGAVAAYPIADGSGSQVDLAYDSALDGQTLRCVIEDGVNTVLVEWTLAVE